MTNKTEKGLLLLTLMFVLVIVSDGINMMVIAEYFAMSAIALPLGGLGLLILLLLIIGLVQVYNGAEEMPHEHSARVPKGVFLVAAGYGFPVLLNVLYGLIYTQGEGVVTSGIVRILILIGRLLAAAGFYFLVIELLRGNDRTVAGTSAVITAIGGLMEAVYFLTSSSAIIGLIGYLVSIIAALLWLACYYRAYSNVKGGIFQRPTIYVGGAGYSPASYGLPDIKEYRPTYGRDADIRDTGWRGYEDRGRGDPNSVFTYSKKSSSSVFQDLNKYKEAERRSR